MQDKLNSQFIVTNPFAWRQAVIIHISDCKNELDNAHDPVGHALQLEHLRWRSGGGQGTAYLLYFIWIPKIHVGGDN